MPSTPARRFLYVALLVLCAGGLAMLGLRAYQTRDPEREARGFVATVRADSDAKRVARELAERQESKELWEASERLQRRVAREVAAHASVIDRELASLVDHPWAGRNFQGDARDFRDLRLSPTQGAVYQDREPHHGYENASVARVQVEGNEILLTYLPADFPPSYYERLLVVEWGQRRYLVPSVDIQRFVDSLNEGLEPRAVGDEHNYVLLRVGDEARPVSGLPGLPAQWREKIRRRPLVARVSSFKRALPSCGAGAEAWELTIDRGSSDGLLEYEDLESPDLPKHCGSFYTMSRTARAAVVSATFVAERCGGRRPHPKAGWRLQTTYFDENVANTRIRAAASKADRAIATQAADAPSSQRCRGSM